MTIGEELKKLYEQHRNHQNGAAKANPKDKIPAAGSSLSETFLLANVAFHLEPLNDILLLSQKFTSGVQE